MSKLKLKFYTKINGTIVRAERVPSLFEIISVNFDELFKAILSSDPNQLPFQILVEQTVLDKLNTEIAKIACSKFYSNVIKVYMDAYQGLALVMEIKLV